MLESFLNAHLVAKNTYNGILWQKLTMGYFLATICRHSAFYAHLELQKYNYILRELKGGADALVFNSLPPTIQLWNT